MTPYLTKISAHISDETADLLVNDMKKSARSVSDIVEAALFDYYFDQQTDNVLADTPNLDTRFERIESSQLRAVANMELVSNILGMLASRFSTPPTSAPSGTDRVCPCHLMRADTAHGGH